MSIVLRIITIVLIATVTLVHAESHAPHKQVPHAHVGHGSHGMAVFGGRQALYASHLPMFRAPHAAQVVLQIRLSDAELDQSLRQRLSETPELWTLAPSERFDLSAFANISSAHPFHASFSQGHFERGGKIEIKKAQVIVERVIYFQSLSEDMRKSSVQRYQMIGKGCEQFAFKHITQRPDFDLISKLPGCAKRARLLTLQKSDLAPPTPQEWQRLLLDRQVPTHIYFETSDLQ